MNRDHLIESEKIQGHPLDSPSGPPADDRSENLGKIRVEIAHAVARRDLALSALASWARRGVR